MSIEVGNAKHVINISCNLGNIHKHVAHISLLQECCLGNSLYTPTEEYYCSITQDCHKFRINETELITRSRKHKACNLCYQS